MRSSSQQLRPIMRHRARGEDRERRARRHTATVEIDVRGGERRHRPGVPRTRRRPPPTRLLRKGRGGRRKTGEFGEVTPRTTTAVRKRRRRAVSQMLFAAPTSAPSEPGRRPNPTRIVAGGRRRAHFTPRGREVDAPPPAFRLRTHASRVSYRAPRAPTPPGRRSRPPRTPPLSTRRRVHRSRATHRRRPAHDACRRFKLGPPRRRSPSPPRRASSIAEVRDCACADMPFALPWNRPREARRRRPGVGRLRGGAARPCRWTDERH